MSVNNFLLGRLEKWAWVGWVVLVEFSIGFFTLFIYMSSEGDKVQAIYDDDEEDSHGANRESVMSGRNSHDAREDHEEAEHHHHNTKKEKHHQQQEGGESLEHTEATQEKGTEGHQEATKIEESSFTKKEEKSGI